MSWYVCLNGLHFVALPVVSPSSCVWLCILAIHMSHHGFHILRMWCELGRCWMDMYCF
jgi:hypothetical protein